MSPGHSVSSDLRRSFSIVISMQTREFELNPMKGRGRGRGGVGC